MADPVAEGIFSSLPATASPAAEMAVVAPTPWQRGTTMDLCLFVANLPSSFSDAELEHHLGSLLGRFGTIVSTRASRDKKQRPFCFVQFQGAVSEDIFKQSLYLGGRSLRIERSRVKSSELPGGKSHGATRHRDDGTLVPTHSPPLSSTESFSLRTLNAEQCYVMGSLPMLGAYHPVFPPAPPVCTVVLTGLPMDGSVTRLAVFKKLKNFGFIHSIELIGPGEWGPEVVEGTHHHLPATTGLRVLVLFDSPHAVERVCFSLNGASWMGCRMICQPLISDPMWNSWYPPGFVASVADQNTSADR